MADDTKDVGDTPEVALDLDDQSTDLESAMRDAMAAVEGRRGEAPAAGAPAGPGDDVAKLRQENIELRDRAIRTLADFDNFRKRSERVPQDHSRAVMLAVRPYFLTVADNLDLALSAQGSAEDLKRGVEMIHRQMSELLRRFGIVEVPAIGQPFDPTLHEAVSREESREVKVPTVVAELRRGYKMHDRLVRPSMVKVAVPAEAAAASSEGSQGPAGGGEEGPAL